MPFSEHSVASVRGHPAQFLRSSDTSGWTSLFIQELILARRTPGFAKPATADATLVVQTGGSGRVEVDRGDGWQGADRHAGSVGFAPHAQAMNVRWNTLSREPVRTVHLYLPHAIMAAAEEEYRVIGRPAASIPFSAMGLADPVIQAISQRLLQAVEASEPDIYAESAVHFLATHLQTMHRFTRDGDTRTTAALADWRIARVLDRMRAAPERPLTIEDLAREACVSPFHFSRLFKAATGETPARFLARLRMERAAALLRKTDMPIALVAAACGYGNHAAFTTAFKRWSGENPMRWRTRKA